MEKMELGTDLEQCVKDWTDLSNEYAVSFHQISRKKISFSNFWKIFFYILLQDLEEAHVKYKTKLDEVLKLQKKCQSAINHQKYRLVFHSVEISGFCCHSYWKIFHFPRLKAIQKHMKDVHPDSDTETEELKDLNKDILRRYEQLKQVWYFDITKKITWNQLSNFAFFRWNLFYPRSLEIISKSF